MSYRSLIELDARLSDKLSIAEKPGLLRNIAIILAHSGDSWFWGAFLVVFWYFMNSFWKQWAVVQFFGIYGLAGVVMGIKFLVKRKRPEGDWGDIYRMTDPHSFPSGHAARAFLIAVIATAFGPAWLTVLLWIWAPLVAMARVMMGVHYLADVIAGAIFGVAVALLGLQFYPSLAQWGFAWMGFSLW